MTSKCTAQTNQEQNNEKPQASVILQRAAVRSVSDTEVQSTEDKEAQPLNNSALSKDFSRVPLSTTKPYQIMAKLTIGPVGDKYEQEADRVAAQVVQRINAPASVQSGEDETVQREEMETKDNEARLMRLPILQRRSSDGGMAATPNLEASINRARGGGQPMENNVRKRMEQGFGADFSGVKIHTDAQSDHLNRSIQARAFTTGRDVFFRQGEYSPGSRGGQELLAHELTHVVQQNEGDVQSAKLQRTSGNQSSRKDSIREYINLLTQDGVAGLESLWQLYDNAQGQFLAGYDYQIETTLQLHQSQVNGGVKAVEHSYKPTSRADILFKDNSLGELKNTNDWGRAWKQFDIELKNYASSQQKLHIYAKHQVPKEILEIIKYYRFVSNQNWTLNGTEIPQELKFRGFDPPSEYENPIIWHKRMEEMNADEEALKSNELEEEGKKIDNEWHYYWLVVQNISAQISDYKTWDAWKKTQGDNDKSFSSWKQFLVSLAKEYGRDFDPNKKYSDVA